MTLLTPTWGRPALTKLFLEYYASLDFFSQMICVQSPEDPERVEVPEPWIVVEAPNGHLAQKMTVGFLAARAFGEKVMCMGSDDFADMEYLRTADAVDADYVMATTLYAYDWATGRAAKGVFSRVGTGRILSLKLLDGLCWEPYVISDNMGRNVGLDGAMDRKVRREKGVDVVMLPDVGMIVDVKTDVNIWSFDHLARNMTPVDPKTITNAFPFLYGNAN